MAMGPKWPRRPFFFSRWVSLSAGFVVNSLNLFSYAFGLFSDSFKELGFSQRGVDLIASFGELGLWSSFLVGLMIERIGPQGVYAAGAVFTFFGLGYVALADGDALPGGVASVAIGFMAANFGTACFGTTAQTVAVRNFPAGDRGKISGVIKCIFGLSSAVLGMVYEGLFGGADPASFLLTLSILVPLLGGATAVLVNLLPPAHAAGYALERAQAAPTGLWPFYAWLGAVAATLGALCVSVALGASLSQPWAGIALLGIIGTALLLPLRYGRVWIYDGSSGAGDVGGYRRVSDEEGDGAYTYLLIKEAAPLLGDASPNNHRRGSPLLANGHGEIVKHDEDSGVPRGLSPARAGSLSTTPSPYAAETNTVAGFAAVVADGGNAGYGAAADMDWRGCLRDSRFYVLWLAFMCGAGAGVTVINNVASLADTLGVACNSSALVTALGIANAFGRLFAGWASDRTVMAGLPRATALAAVLTLASAVHLSLAAGVAPLLYPLVAIAGVCYGAMFSLTLAICGDLFGPTHIGANNGLLDLGPAAGSFVFATWAASYFYGRGGDDDGGGDDDDCRGVGCFRGTFLVTGTATAAAAVMVLAALVWPPCVEARRRRRPPVQRAKRQYLGYL